MSVSLIKKNYSELAYSALIRWNYEERATTLGFLNEKEKGKKMASNNVQR